MAALDLKHPRDLFDMTRLLENEGINHELRKTIITNLVSYDRFRYLPVNPVLLDLTTDFKQNLNSINKAPIELSTLPNKRQQLITNITYNTRAQ